VLATGNDFRAVEGIHALIKQNRISTLVIHKKLKRHIHIPDRGIGTVGGLTTFTPW
jgi:hypothetical protein